MKLSGPRDELIDEVFERVNGVDLTPSQFHNAGLLPAGFQAGSGL